MLTRPFCSNWLLFGDDGDDGDGDDDGDDGDGDDGRCGVVEFFSYCSPHVTTHSMSTRARAHATPYRTTTDRTYITI